MVATHKKEKKIACVQGHVEQMLTLDISLRIHTGTECTVRGKIVDDHPYKLNIRVIVRSYTEKKNT